MSVYVGMKKGDLVHRSFDAEYHCGGCGWPVSDHDSYCPECGGAFQESFATEQVVEIEQDYDAMEDGVPECRIWKCHFCSHRFPDFRGFRPRYCPRCGAKRKED